MLEQEHLNSHHREDSHVYLEQAALFKGLESEELNEIIKTLQAKTVKRGELIYAPHEMPGNVYLLKKGEVTLYREKDGVKAIIGLAKPYDLFGDMCFGNHCKDGTFAEASREAEVCKISREDFLSIIEKHSVICLNLLRFYSARTEELEDLLNDFITKDAKARIISHLQRLAGKYGEYDGPHRTKIKIKLTHAKIGSMLGLTRETVSKVLSTLKKEGAIEYEFHNIIITGKLRDNKKEHQS